MEVKRRVLRGPLWDIVILFLGSACFHLQEQSALSVFLQPVITDAF